MSRIKKYQREIGPGWVHATAGSPAAQGANFGPPTEYGVQLMRVAHFKYDFSIDGGTIGLINLAKTVVLPATAIIYDGMLKSVIAPVGAGASIAFGTSAGSAANSIKAATAITSFTLGALLDVIPVSTAAASVAMTASGSITMTISGANLTAGLVEGWLEYFVAANA